MAEEVWHRLGHEDFVAVQPWPEADVALLSVDEVVVPVQVDGKVRDEITIPKDADQDAAVAAARARENVVRHLDGRAVVKVIWVPNRMLAFVTKAA